MRFKITLLILITFVLFYKKCNLTAQGLTEENIPRIIIITLSGVRNIDSIEDPLHQYIPNIWNKMLKEGVLYTNLYDSNYEFHMSPVDCINTGKSYFAYYGIPQLRTPSLFQYIRKRYNLPANKLWSIGHFHYDGCVKKTEDYPEVTYPCQISVRDYTQPSKYIQMSPELKEILNRRQLRFIESFNKTVNGWNSVHHWDVLEEVLYEIFKKIIQNFRPYFVHYVMADTEVGHYDTFGRYVLALRRMDARIFQIWQMIQNDPFYKDRTYLIVSPDHGRDAYFMQHYENGYDNPSKVWLYIYGPGILQGKIINRPISHMDIFATVKSIKAIETHATKGRPLKDCFRN